MALFKKRKKESVAIPFLVSMIITLFIIGIPILKYYNNIIEKKTEKESTASQTVFTPTEDNDTTLLFTFTPDDQTLRDSFMLLRTSALEKSFMFIPVSNDMLCGSQKMSEIFDKGGIIDLKKAIEQSLEIKIDRYMALDTQSITLIWDSIGGVNYPVPDGLKGLNEGTQFLDSTFLIKLISNKKFTEEARTVTIGSVFSELMANASGTRVADIFDITYNSLVNMAETDITSIDYDNQKKAIEYILRSNQFKSAFRVPGGNATENGINMTKDAIEQLKSETGLKN
ncbi:MAG: LCP family protein [Oscillospiraceae bacterium]|nr:LCP family protein [Oscillospiraceae bacterium]